MPQLTVRTTRRNATQHRALKEAQHAEKEAKKAAAASAKEAADRIDNVTFLSVADTYEPFGDLTLVMSRSRTGRQFSMVSKLAEKAAGDKVWLRGRLASIRVKGGSCFLVLRQDSFHTVQAVYFKDKENPERSQKMIKYLSSLTVESVIDLEGTLSEADVKSCSVQNMEVSMERIYAVSKAAAILPFLVEDAARSEEEVEASQDTDRPFPRLGQVRCRYATLLDDWITPSDVNWKGALLTMHSLPRSSDWTIVGWTFVFPPTTPLCGSSLPFANYSVNLSTTKGFAKFTHRS